MSNSPDGISTVPCVTASHAAAIFETNGGGGGVGSPGAKSEVRGDCVMQNRIDIYVQGYEGVYL